LQAPVFPPASQAEALRPVDMRPAAFLSLHGPFELKEEIVPDRRRKGKPSS